MQFIDLKIQQDRIRPQIESAIQKVLDHGKYIMGPEVFELEEALAAFVGSKHCITCSSGTDALLLGLMASRIGPGDAVLTTPFTFIATAETISLLGATPVFVDIDPDTYTIDPTKIAQTLERLLAEGRLRPRGIVPVDIFGCPADYNTIMPLAKKHGLFVLQDAAQAFGAEQGGIMCSAHGHVGATSFFPAKPLGCYGDGGAVFTDDDSLAEGMRSIRVHGKGLDKYNNVRIGLNGRMDTIQAAILLTKLSIYPEEIDLRQQVAHNYSQHLSQLSQGIKQQHVPEGSQSVYAQFCIESPHRDIIRARLKDRDIPTAVYYPQPLHRLDAYAHLSTQEADLSISEQLCRRILALPIHPYLPVEDQTRIIDILNDISL